MLMQRLAAVWLLLCLSLSSAWAQTAPTDVIRSTSEQMLSALKSQRPALQQDNRKIYPLVEKIVLPHFDFDAMSRWVLGRSWKEATPDQQQRFVKEFRNLLVRTYAKALLEYSDEQVRIPPQTITGKDDVTVRTEIVPKNGKAIPIQYAMHLKDNQWQVYDVIIDGVSIVTNYRSSIAEQVRKDGIEGTIKMLAQRSQAQGD